MEEKITLCGDNCVECPRFNADSQEKLSAAAELWYRVGWRNKVVSNEEIKCTGCSADKQCTYHLAECIKLHNIKKCNQCREFPCNKIRDMLERSENYRKKCEEVCSEFEYNILKRDFFEKEINLLK